MKANHLKRQLKEAKKIWQKECQNPDLAGMEGFMPGVLKGLDEALRIVERQQRMQVKKDMAERQFASRWRAVNLYRACRVAYGRLKYSDRAGAIKALKRALEKSRS